MRYCHIGLIACLLCVQAHVAYGGDDQEPNWREGCHRYETDAECQNRLRKEAFRTAQQRELEERKGRGREYYTPNAEIYRFTKPLVVPAMVALGVAAYVINLYRKPKDTNDTKKN